MPQWRPAMDHIGIDVHKNASRVCIRTETGQLLVRTDLESFAKWLEKRSKARILIESSTEKAGGGAMFGGARGIGETNALFQSRKVNL
jgi:hypothetical protein